MISIWLNIIIVLLYCGIAAEASRNCSEPNEEFSDRGCETKCETSIYPCHSYREESEQNLTSGCFCTEGTFRDPESNKCISVSKCTEKVCGYNRTFTEYFGGDDICTDDGFIVVYDLFKAITACKCSEGFITSCTEDGKCITDAECKIRETTPISC